MSEDKRETGLSAFGVVAILIMVGLLGWAGWYAVECLECDARGGDLAPGLGVHGAGRDRHLPGRRGPDGVSILLISP